MKKLGCLIVLVLFALACKKDSFFRVTTSEVIKELEPGFATTANYRSGADTISLEIISKNIFFENGPGFENGGSLNDFDRTEMERREVIIGSDTPYFRFEFITVSTFNSASPTQSEDNMTVYFKDSLTTLDQLSFNFLDSLSCGPGPCVLSDTLQLDSLSYINVYHRPGNNGAALFINRAFGLAGFRTTDNKTYERLP